MTAVQKHTQNVQEKSLQNQLDAIWVTTARTTKE